MGDWNASQYMKFGAERTRPAIDLIGQIEDPPASILDIGCGPGNSTKQLFDRFPSAEILGVDVSQDMLERARAAYPHLHFAACQIPQELSSLGKFDLLFSNACLHWIPDHKTLFPRLMNHLNPSGTLAVQMPLVRLAPFYQILAELVAEDKWRCLSAISNFHNLTPEETYDILAGVSEKITMWETTYYHPVASLAEVIEWYRGSGLRPYLEALPPEKRPDFLADLSRALEKVFCPAADGKVLLKIPRFFFLARKKS